MVRTLIGFKLASSIFATVMIAATGTLVLCKHIRVGMCDKSETLDPDRATKYKKS